MITANGWSQSDQNAIREQLDRILNSGPFQQAPRRQRFLEYIVNEVLAGRGERLKGYNVALAVFDRGAGGRLVTLLRRGPPLWPC